MVTNLSSFPSALTVIPVPDGDIKKHRHTFIVNEDLKRLGCSGRSGLALTDPTEATQAKFQQLYKTSDRIPFFQSVIELIKLCQIALYMFEKLDHEYVDGLLCDVTERAVSNWWTEVGAEHYNFEPTDGILGPSTVAALLGMLMGARNRLHWQGAPVSKDVFEIECTKRGIAYFQKSQKLDKTRRLDRQTLFRLHTATAKAAAGEGWRVQKAVKSTVSEIGGKRGEIVLDMVSGKDKGGLADVETLDIDKFINLAYGERPKWLWHGKPRRTPLDHHHHDQGINNTSLAKTDAFSQVAKRTHSLPVEDDPEAKRKDELLSPDSGPPTRAATTVAESPGERDALRRTVFKSVAGKMSDARSGLGRIKDVVGGGRRGHTSRHSVSTRDEFSDIGNGTSHGPFNPPQNSGLVTAPLPVGRAFTWKNKPEEYLTAIKRGDPDALPGLREVSQDSSSTVESNYPKGVEETQKFSDQEEPQDVNSNEAHKDISRQAPSTVPSAIDESEPEGRIVEKECIIDSKSHILSRRHSCDVSQLLMGHVLNENRWARRMSFGDAEQAILTWEEIFEVGDIEDVGVGIAATAQSEAVMYLSQQAQDIVSQIEPWVDRNIRMVRALDERYGRDKADLHSLYSQLNEACQRVRYSSDEILAEERATLTESVKDIEALVARLEYEINSLVQKTNDVEDGILNFARQVEDVERRADELKVQLESESWLHWFVRTLTGVGTGPNITRSTA